MTELRESCHCDECGEIHKEFIEHFNKWPLMSHEEGQTLKKTREGNLESWEQAIRSSAE